MSAWCGLRLVMGQFTLERRLSLVGSARQHQAKECSSREPVATCQDSRKVWERKDLHPVSDKRYDLITHITLFLSSAPIFHRVILGPGCHGGTRLCCYSLLKACGWSREACENVERERERESERAPRSLLGQWTRKRTVVSFSSICRLIINVSHGPVGWEWNYTIQTASYACMDVCTVVVLRGQVLLYSGYLFSDAIGCRSVHLLATFFFFFFVFVFNFLKKEKKCWFFCFRTSSCTDRLLDWYAIKI